jgi:hypothetical protein
MVAILVKDMMEVKSGSAKARIISQIGRNIFRLQSMKWILEPREGAKSRF